MSIWTPVKYNNIVSPWLQYSAYNVQLKYITREKTWYGKVVVVVIIIIIIIISIIIITNTTTYTVTITTTTSLVILIIIIKICRRKLIFAILYIRVYIYLRFCNIGHKLHYRRTPVLPIACIYSPTRMSHCPHTMHLATKTAYLLFSRFLSLCRQ